jgi:type IV pilus assembly protein PilX
MKTLPVIGTRTQGGAALVVGLVLLVILTLLAISGMTTATTELTMAGNEQYQAAAFQAAETGIEQTIAGGRFNTAGPVTVVPYDLPNDTQVGIVTVPRGTSGPPAGYTYGEFGAEHFEIQSAGTAPRNANATHTQGLWIIVQDAN